MEKSCAENSVTSGLESAVSEAEGPETQVMCSAESAVSEMRLRHSWA